MTETLGPWRNLTKHQLEILEFRSSSSYSRLGAPATVLGGGILPSLGFGTRIG